MASMAVQTILTTSPPSSAFHRLLSPQLPYCSSFRGVSLKLARQSFSPLVNAMKHHHHKQPLPVVVAATKNDAFVLESVSNVEDYDVFTLTQEDGGAHELWSTTDDEDGSIACVAAVPKKRTSKSKTRIRKNIWKRKAYFSALKALSLAKSIYTGKSKSFLSDKLKNE